MFEASRGDHHGSKEDKRRRVASPAPQSSAKRGRRRKGARGEDEEEYMTPKEANDVLNAVGPIIEGPSELWELQHAMASHVHWKRMSYVVI